MEHHQGRDRAGGGPALHDVAEEAGQHRERDEPEVQEHHRGLHVAVLPEALASGQPESHEQADEQQDLQREVDIGRGPGPEDRLHA